MRTRTLAGGALLLLPVLAFAPRPAPRASLAGTIEGHVQLAPRPARRVASHYPGAAGGTHLVGAVPAVAYILGPVAGVAPAGGGQRPRLAQQDTTFRPVLLRVPVGTRVDFANQDPFFHNVFSYSSVKRFDLGRFPRGETRSVTFDRPGVVKIYCEIHQWMRSAVVVVENPFHDEVDRDGNFRITGVPAGRYRLAVWDVDRGERVVEVTVPASGTTRVDVRL